MLGWTTNGSLVTDPSVVSTCTGPVAAPGGTVADTCSSSSTVKTASAPANETALVAESPVPMIVTVARTGP